MKKMLYKIILVFIACVSISDTTKACSCFGSSDICQYLSLYPQSIFLRVSIDTVDDSNQSIPFPDYGVTIIDQYNGSQNISQTYWLTSKDMESCARPLSPGAQVGDTFLITLFASSNIDTGSLWTCSFIQPIKNDSVYNNNQPGFHIAGLQDTINTCLERNLSTKAPDLASTIQVYPNPARNLLNIDNRSGATIQSLQLLDISGRKVLFLDGKNSSSVPLEKLNNGLYFLQIKTDKGILNRKIQIEK